MSADQTPAADPTPGSSRVDVAGLRAAAEVAQVGTPEGRSWFTEEDLRKVFGREDSDFIAAADPTTVLALLDERDDLAARLATAEADAAASRARFTGLVHLAETEATRRLAAEAEVERLRAIALPTADLVQELGLARENLHHSRAMSDAHFDLKQRAEHRAEVAERQVQAGLAVLDGHDHADTCGAVLSPGAKYPCSCWKADLTAALAPLDPDAPTGHDGHGEPEYCADHGMARADCPKWNGQGDPDTHQGDTEAGDGR